MGASSVPPKLGEMKNVNYALGPRFHHWYTCDSGVRVAVLVNTSPRERQIE